MKICLLIIFLAIFESAHGQEINKKNIDIVRDGWGIPHIYAATDAEAAYGLAYAQAEDEFEVLQQAFIIAKGLSGVHKGIKGAPADYLLQFLRIPRLVDQQYEREISADFKRVLEGYCAGINAYAKHNQHKILLRKVFPLTPKDVIQYSLVQVAMLSGIATAVKDIRNETVEALQQLKPAGSNAFAFNSKKMVDGSTVLVINPHQQFEGLISWYEAHVVSQEGWNMAGALLPGSPIPIIGTNENIAWTHTVNNPDNIDVYQLQTLDNCKEAYLVDNECMQLEQTKIKLKIRILFFNININRKAYASLYGPTLLNDKGAFSIRMPALFNIKMLEQWFRMNKANNYTQFRKALDMQAIPVYNIMYADKADTIFFLANAKLPIRQNGFDWKQTIPGNTSKTLWTDFHPVSSLPQALQPSSGYLFNCNNSPYNATTSPGYDPKRNYDSTMGYAQDENNRSKRFEELIQQYKQVDLPAIKTIKYDVQYPRKFEFEEDVNILFNLDANKYPHIADAIALLYNWDRQADLHNTIAPLVGVMLYHMTEGIYFKQAYKPLTEQKAVEVIQFAKQYMLKHFGKLEVPLGQYQVLVRGETVAPLHGLPDVLADIESGPYKKGQVKGVRGDCYIAFIQFKNGSVAMETVTNYGSSNHKKSRHYADQLPLFINKETKQFLLNKEIIYRSATAIYNPK